MTVGDGGWAAVGGMAARAGTRVFKLDKSLGGEAGSGCGTCTDEIAELSVMEWGV